MMNERIKELAEQATTEEHDGFRYFDKAKFAELIVLECADISNQAEKQCQHPGTQIMKHFGVETKTPFEIGQKLYRDGYGISHICGAVKHDSEMEEAHQGYIAAMNEAKV